MVNLVVVTAKFMVNLAVWRVLPYKILAMQYDAYGVSLAGGQGLCSLCKPLAVLSVG